MKRNAALAGIILLASFTLSACAPAASGGQSPEFLGDLGKTLSELKTEHPEGEVMVRLDGFPDCAALCFGEPGADYVYYFFGTQAGDGEKAMDQLGDQLKCAGAITTANILFPDMEGDLSFADFFSLIGVEEYEYLGADTVAEGWIRFLYQDMEVMVSPTGDGPDGQWDVTGEEIVKYDAVVSVIDPELESANSDLADPVMFEEITS
mgnify:CR=1 FL=1